MIILMFQWLLSSVTIAKNLMGADHHMSKTFPLSTLLKSAIFQLSK